MHETSGITMASTFTSSSITCTVTIHLDLTSPLAELNLSCFDDFLRVLASSSVVALRPIRWLDAPVSITHHLGLPPGNSNGEAIENLGFCELTIPLIFFLPCLPFLESLGSPFCVSASCLLPPRSALEELSRLEFFSSSCLGVLSVSGSLPPHSLFSPRDLNFLFLDSLRSLYLLPDSHSSFASGLMLPSEWLSLRIVYKILSINTHGVPDLAS